MIRYMIFDARAMNNVDDALCLFCTSNFKEAKEMQKEYGACVIGKSDWAVKNSSIEIIEETFYDGIEK